ncbi:MAG: hypothetical protein ABI895_11470 [Deltaproteobacteria bacterium]
MSRKTKTKRLARRSRVERIKEEKAIQRAADHKAWLERPLTENDLANAIARFSNLRGQGGVRFGFFPMFDFWVKASNPEELVETTREVLRERSKGESRN